MKSVSRLVRLQVCAMLGAAVLVASIGGCPPGITPTTPLALTAAASAEATVDKAVNLTATITGGTTPYTIAWALTGGPWASITDGTTANASFVPQQGGIYTFTVTVTDSGAVPQTRTAQVEVPVGDIQFLIPSGAGVQIPGNPALIIQSNTRAALVRVQPRVSVYDPRYADDQTTQMTVTYDIVSIPTAARPQDVSLDRSFDTISNQGTGDFDNAAGNLPTLDGVVGLTIRPNPDVTFQTLTNLATTVDNFGAIVPGAYVFRASVTNPDGVLRSRDLVIQMSIESIITAPYGGTGDGGPAVSAGPNTVRVRELPTAGSGQITDRVLTPSQTAAMTVTVFPATDTTYRFYLIDNVAGVGVARPDLVAQSLEQVSATGSPQDITLTIGAAGMPTGTYDLWYEAFDALGQLFNVQVTVNAALDAVRFHATDDYYGLSSLNAAQVGVTSNDPDTPTAYKGWMGAPVTYGDRSALADINLDGVLDVISTDAVNVYAFVGGFVQGSTAALRHPVNNGNFGQNLGVTANLLAGVAGDRIAVGDLNGDNLPDIAVTVGLGAAPQVEIYFHTGDPGQPYSNTADQRLTILVPATDRLNFLVGAQTLTAGLAVDVTQFGTQLGIFDQNADGQPDLIITDPGFSQVHARYVADPGLATGTIAPPPCRDFYLGQEGRVYVFAGGATGELRPGRPALITSLITERQIDNAAAPAPPPPTFAVNPTLTTTFAETNAKYTLVYLGAELDRIGDALANGGDGFVVGAPRAAANGTMIAAFQIVGPVLDTETIVVTVPHLDRGAIPTNSVRTYEFDTTAAPGVGAGNIAVPLGADTSAPNTITQLITTINGDAVGQKMVTAALDPVRSERIILTYDYSAADAAVRSGATFAVTETMAYVSGLPAPFGDNEAINLGPGVGQFVQNNDGRVYRVASALASGTLATSIDGLTNSDMGLGAGLAFGAFNGSAPIDDLAIAALDDGTAAGVNNGGALDINDDGAVFLLLDASNTLPALPISGVGATTARSGGWLGVPLNPTGVGAALAFGDANNDGLEELFFIEPGFDHMYVIRGAATPSTSPDITFSGIGYVGAAASLGSPGTFLFGDITGDSYSDWVFIEGGNNFGFLGIER